MNLKTKELYRQKTEILKALAHPTRLAIIDILTNSEKTVEEIRKILGEKQSNISKHLSVLKRSGIVDDRKVGLHRFYYLKYKCVSNFSFCVNETLKYQLKEKKKFAKYLL